MNRQINWWTDKQTVRHTNRKRNVRKKDRYKDRQTFRNRYRWSDRQRIRQTDKEIVKIDEGKDVEKLTYEHTNDRLDEKTLRSTIYVLPPICICYLFYFDIGGWSASELLQ